MSPSELIDDLKNYGSIGYNIQFDTLKEAIYTLSDIGSFVLGVICVLLLVGIGLITCFDSVYLVLPTTRDFYEKYRNSRIKDNSARIFRIDLVSKDAIESVDIGYRTNTAPIVIYIKKRIKTYLVAGALLTILIISPSVIVSPIANILVNLLELIEHFGNNIGNSIGGE